MINITILNKKNTSARNTVLFLLGRFISLFGTYTYDFAISLYVLKTTNSAKMFSISLAIAAITRVLLSSFAGVISDKLDRKKLAVISDIMSGIVVLALFLLATADSLRISYIFITTFLLTICNVFFDVTIIASLPNLVDNKNLTRINSLNTSMDSATQILSPIVGGVVFAFIDIKLLILINGISFIISAIAEQFIDFNYNIAQPMEEEPENEGKKESLGADLKKGFSYIRSNQVLYTIIIFSLAMNFIIQFGLVVPVPYILNNVICLSESQYGIIQAMFAIGMLCGSTLLSLLPQREKNYKNIIGGLSIFSIFFTMIGIFIVPGLFALSKFNYFIIYSVIYLILAISMTITNVPIIVTIQKFTPDNLRGRVFGLMTAMSGGIAPLGMIISGTLVEIIPAFILPISSGIVLIIITFIISMNKELKEF